MNDLRPFLLKDALFGVLNRVGKQGLVDITKLTMSSETDIVHFWVSDRDPTKIAYLTTERFEKLTGTCVHDFLNIHESLEALKAKLDGLEGRGTFGKVGKLMNKCFSNFDQKKIEELAALLKGSEVTSEIVTDASRISSIYSMATHENGGNLRSSCMRPEYSREVCSEWFEVYDDNAYGVHIESEGGKLKGRALLWALNYQGEDRIFVDRIYGTEAFKCHVREYWIKKEALIRIGDCHSYEGFHDYKHNLERDEEYTLTVDVCHTSYSYSPYCDTFKQIDRQHSRIVAACDGELTQCNGTGFTDEADESMYTCDGCDTRVHEEDVISVSDSGFYCNECAVQTDDGTGVLRNDAVELDESWYALDSDAIVMLSDGDYVLQEKAVYCSPTDEVILCADSQYCAHREYDVATIDSVTLEDGTEAWDEDDELVKIDGLWFLKDIHEGLSIHLCEDGNWRESHKCLERETLYSHEYHALDDKAIHKIDGEYKHIDDIDLEEVAPKQRYKIAGVLK